jgi:hypothetical protein
LISNYQTNGDGKGVREEEKEGEKKITDERRKKGKKMKKNVRK